MNTAPGPITLSPPPVRMVVVTAHRSPGEAPFADFHPVVALAAWHADDGPRVEPILCCPDPNWGAVGTIAKVVEGFCDDYRLVPAPWPEAEDEARLAEHVRDLLSLPATP